MSFGRPPVESFYFFTSYSLSVASVTLLFILSAVDFCIMLALWA